MEEKNLTIPYIVHEADAARQERHTRRLWITTIVLIVALFVSNMAWLKVWNSYDYKSEVSLDSGEGNANFIGGDGEITNGED